MSTISTVTSHHLPCPWGYGDPPSRLCTWSHMSTVTRVTPFPNTVPGATLIQSPWWPPPQTLFIFCLLTSHPLTVLSGGGLVTKSCLTFVTPWTIAGKVPPSMRFSRKEYWSGLPFPSPGNLLDPGIEPGSPALQAGSLPAELLGKPLLLGRSLIIALNGKG